MRDSIILQNSELSDEGEGTEGDFVSLTPTCQTPGISLYDTTPP